MKILLVSVDPKGIPYRYATTNYDRTTAVVCASETFEMTFDTSLHIGDAPGEGYALIHEGSAYMNRQGHVSIVGDMQWRQVYANDHFTLVDR